MPFEIAPQESEIKVGEFQDVADAMLRGCKMHPMGVGALCMNGMTCAQGAAFIGAGVPLVEGWGNFAVWDTPFGQRMHAAARAYKLKYGTHPAIDNNAHTFTREQIAARIAAL